MTTARQQSASLHRHRRSGTPPTACCSDAPATRLARTHPGGPAVDRAAGHFRKRPEAQGAVSPTTIAGSQMINDGILLRPVQRQTFWNPGHEPTDSSTPDLDEEEYSGEVHATPSLSARSCVSRRSQQPPPRRTEARLAGLAPCGTGPVATGQLRGGGRAPARDVRSRSANTSESPDRWTAIFRVPAPRWKRDSWPSCFESSNSPVARPSGPSVVGPPRPIGSEPRFPAEGGADACSILANPERPFGRDQRVSRRRRRTGAMCPATVPKQQRRRAPPTCSRVLQIEGTRQPRKYAFCTPTG